MSDESVGIGVIGCGGFAVFACGHFVDVPGVRIIAAADIFETAAKGLAERFDGAQVMEVDGLVRHPDVDLVYIATPPNLHYPQAMLALDAGKHVICEKPMAMNLGQASEMIAAAAENDRVLVTNLMQRYNPLSDIVKRLIDSKVLGEVLHGYFENYAGDEKLGPDHWFWDKKLSGGIFIEHVVHFFDLFAKWLGPGEVVAAQASLRPGTDIEDQVQCTVRYRDGIHVNHYHGFTQSGHMDRQELRILFERGDLTLSEWVPTRARLQAVVDDAGLEQLAGLFPGAEVTVVAEFDADDRRCTARHKDFEITKQITLVYGQDVDKQARYGEIVKAMLTDQLAWIRDHSHLRQLTEANGRDSLAMAVQACRLTSVD